MTTTTRALAKSLISLAALCAGATFAAPSLAQPSPAGVQAAKPMPPAPPPTSPDPKKQGEEPVRPEPTKLAELTLPEKGADPLAAAFAPQPGGLTPDDVAARAVQTRRSIRAKQADLRAAQAKVDQALVNFFPRVSASATYTRLSDVGGSGLGSGALVGARNEGLLLAGPCPAGVPAPACVVDQKGELVGAAKFSFPSLQNVYSLTASIAVPVSDYVLRISQGYAAASHGANAARISAEAETLAVATDAKIAFFNWARAKGQAVVVAQALSTTKAHLNDAKVAQSAGMVSRADVLRIEAQVAAAEQGLAEAEAFVAVATEQLRIVMQVPADKELTIGIDILKHDPQSLTVEALDVLQQRALEKRLEIRALDETQYSLQEAIAISRAGYFPRVDAFADVTYANPNQRIFPQKDEFRGTWDAGIRLSWTLNDTFSALGAVAETKARAEGLAEQKAALMEGLRLEVTAARADLQKALASLDATARGLTAAEESMRVRQLLFRAGKATSTDLIDAERETTTAQFREIDAHVGLLVAKTKLLHATGRDVKADAPDR